MDAAALKAFEDRAASAEQQIAALESKLAGGATSSGVDVQRYISELQELRKVLVAAKTEEEALEARIAELETANSKLAYQVKHLKKAVKEGDEKIAKLTTGAES